MTVNTVFLLSPFFNKSLAALVLSSLIEFAFFGKYVIGQERKCFILSTEGPPPHRSFQVCYFGPNTTSSIRVPWNESRSICADLGATLPVVSHRVIEGTLENYLDTLHLKYQFWTAGKATRSSEWKWSNGKTYTGKAIIKKFEANTVASVTKELTFIADHPFNKNNFLCQIYDGHRCESKGAVNLTKGCLIRTTNRTTNASDARNECIDLDGDFPVLDNDLDLQRVTPFFDGFSESTRFWVGLRRMWWTWNGKDEINFTNWANGESSNLEKECIVFDAASAKWRQQYCYDNERVLCQKVSERADEKPAGNQIQVVALATGIVVTIFIVILIAVLIFIFVKKPMTKESFRNALSRCRLLNRVRNDEIRIVEQSEETKAKRKSHHQGQQGDNCQGHLNNNSQGQIGRMSKVISADQRSSHREDRKSRARSARAEHEVNPLIPSTEEIHDQKNRNSKGHAEGQGQGLYALIGRTEEPEVDEPEGVAKAIVYAQLEFDGGDSNPETQNILPSNDAAPPGAASASSYGAVETSESKMAYLEESDKHPQDNNTDCP